MGYTTLATGGSVGNRNLRIYLYPNTSGTDNECENAINNALQSMGDQLLNYNSIDYYEININYDHPNLSDGSKSEFKSNFNSWYHNQGYDAYDGCHTGVSGNFDGGLADGADCSGCTAFVNDRDCVVGVGTAKEVFKNTAIQEVLHTAIRNDISGVQSLIEDSEHDLGQVWGDGAVSPMATGYVDTHSRHGDCSTSNAWIGTYKTKLTGCTKLAVYETADVET